MSPPSWLQRSKGILDVIVNLLRQPPHPPNLAPAICGIPLSSNASTSSEQNILNDFRIVFGVPKFRTPKPRIMKRKFAYTRLLHPEENLVTCKCGFSHHISTICMVCYEKVRSVTNLIKQEMMKYNPYLGERQDKPFFVKYENEADAETPKPSSNAKVIKIKKERDSWFTSRFSENDKSK